MPVIGFLRSTSLADSALFVAAFRQGLKETGFIEGQNVIIEFRWAEGRVDRLPSLVADLIQRPAVIVANSISALAAKAATASIPIVFTSGGDPVQDGLVASLNRPNGNVTGVNFSSEAIGGKRLELLQQLVPKATTIGALVNPNSQTSEAERTDVEKAVQAIGHELVIMDASSNSDIEAAFGTFIQRGAGGLLVGSGPFLTSNRDRIIALAARYALPASYPVREFVTAGGLMSYGTSIAAAYREAGIYTGRILKGEKAGDLPVVQSNKLDLVINLRTARALGLEVPPTLLARADEVIE
jgi:putative ABC transport system substrate-binding protein